MNAVTASAEVVAARAARLHYCADGQPGYRRLRHGKAFRYVDCEGRALRDAGVLDRIRRLAIPPA